MIVESGRSAWILGYACYCFYLQSKEVMINKRKRNKWKLTLATNSKSIGNHWSSISSFKNKFAFTWFYHRYVNILIVYNQRNERNIFTWLNVMISLIDEFYFLKYKWSTISYSKTGYCIKYERIILCHWMIFYEKNWCYNR